MAKLRQTHRVVKAGHPKIVVAQRASAKVETIHVVAIAAQVMAHLAVAHPRPVVAATLVHRVPQAVVKAIAARHQPADVAAMVAAVPTAAAAATTAATTAAAQVADQAMVVVAVLAVTAVVKETERRGHGGVSVASLHRVVVAGLATAETAAIRAAATLATTVAHLRRALLTVAVTMRAARIVRRVPAAVAEAGAIAMA
jgi:hypothetical protein